MNTLPTAKQVRQTLSAYAVSSTAHGLTLFIIDLLLYLAALAVVLFAPWLAVKLLAAIVAGANIANLVTLGHDAAHNSLTRSRPLNKLIAFIAFTPALFNYRLWLYDHHQLHHHSTNENQPGSFTPLSKPAFDALPRWKQRLQRLYRSRSLWTLGLYYIVERWWQVNFVPRRDMPDSVQRSGWPHFAYLLVYCVGFIALLAAAPLYSDTSALTAILLGFVVPFYVFQSLFSFTVYIQHTHPRAAWFNARPDRNTQGRQDLLAIQLRFPKWFTLLTHSIFDHPAHHVHPAIPSYRLSEAQAKLNAMVGPAVISERFSLAWFAQVRQRCKLYDYEQHRWLDFDGKPSSRVTLATAAEADRQVWRTRTVSTN